MTIRVSANARRGAPPPAELRCIDFSTARQVGRVRMDGARALLEEAGGDPERAIKTWRAVRANQPEAASPLARRAEAAIKRLAR